MLFCIIRLGMQNKRIKRKRALAIVSLVDAMVFYEIISLIYDHIGVREGFGWAYFLSLALPLVGVAVAIAALFNTKRSWKILPAVGLIANLAIFGMAVLVYSFSKLQF